MPNVEEVLLARISPLTCYTFHTLMNAVGKAYILQGLHPVTVLIPSDIAFEALHEGVVYDLLKDIDKLEELLNFHLVPMKLTTSDMTRLALQMVDQDAPSTARIAATARPVTLQVETLSAYPLTMTFDHELQVNGVKVSEADIMADNGVVHILESILWPPGLSEASFVPEVQYQHVSSLRGDPAVLATNEPCCDLTLVLSSSSNHILSYGPPKKQLERNCLDRKC